MTHMAVTGSVHGSNVTWMELFSEAQYEARWRSPGSQGRTARLGRAGVSQHLLWHQTLMQYYRSGEIAGSIFPKRISTQSSFSSSPPLMISMDSGSRPCLRL